MFELLKDGLESILEHQNGKRKLRKRIIRYQERTKGHNSLSFCPLGPCHCPCHFVLFVLLVVLVLVLLSLSFRPFLSVICR